MRRCGMASPSLAESVTDAYERLTPTERKVADVVVADPELVAFGTVSDLAERSGTSGASVVRLAAKLGFDGYTEMQESVRHHLRSRLRPTVERIRERPDRDVVGRVMRAGLDAVHDTLGRIDGSDFDRCVALLSDRGRRVRVVSGDAGAGVAVMAVSQLSMLRPGVERVDGNPVALARHVAAVERGDVVLALDLPRYDTWVGDWAVAAIGRGATLVALSDSAVSSLARAAEVSFAIEAEGAGPFDTYVGAMALVEALIAGVARRTRAAATRSIDRIELAWQEGGVLRD